MSTKQLDGALGDMDRSRKKLSDQATKELLAAATKGGFKLPKGLPKIPGFGD